MISPTFSATKSLRRPILFLAAMLVSSLGAIATAAESLLEIPPNVATPEPREWGKLEEDEAVQLPAMNAGPAAIIKEHAVNLRVSAALIACREKGLAAAVGPSESDLADYALSQVGDMEPEVPVSMRTAMSIAAAVSYYRAGLIDSQVITYELSPEYRESRCKDWRHTAHQILNERVEELKK